MVVPLKMQPPSKTAIDPYRYLGTTIAACIPWLFLTPDVVIVDILAVIRYVSTNDGPSTVETNLDFRGSANNMPPKSTHHQFSDL